MAKHEDILDTPLLQFAPGDDWKIRDACEGTFITASSGGGKTSTVGKNIALSFLKMPILKGAKEPR